MKLTDIGLILPDLHLPKYCFWGKAPMVGWGKAPITGRFAPHTVGDFPLVENLQN